MIKRIWLSILFLKISGAMYYVPGEDIKRDIIDGPPGVPQTSVSMFNLESGITLLNPKSTIIISEVRSGLERKRRFSGLRSRWTIS